MQGGRFIPNRGSVMNMEISEALLFATRKEESREEISPSRVAYRKLLADTLLNGRTRIFSFCNKPSTPIQSLPEPPLPPQVKPAKQRRHIPQILYFCTTRVEMGRSAEKTFDADDIVGDDRFNLLDWRSKNLLSIALYDAVFVWNRTNDDAYLLGGMTVTEDYAPVTSVSWAADGRHIAVGCNNSTVDLYDATSNRQLRTLSDLDQGPICSLAWNNHILTTGGENGTIINHDVRIQSDAIRVYRGHNDAVCGLKWSSSGEQLASGGNDKLLHIWAVSNCTHIYRFNNHIAAIQAVAWCHFKDNLLASGGGETDHCIKLWNIDAGTCVKSVDTGSQVCSMLWGKNEQELLSSHGGSTNQLAGHTSPVLYTTQSPDGCRVASASEMLKIWRISEIPTKKTKHKNPHFFGHLICTYDD